MGFEVEIAQLLAGGLGREPRFIQVGFTSLDAAAARGDFDIGLSGIEDSPARRARLAVTIPYYEFREVLTVREADAARFRTLADLRGRRVATLGATLAYDLLVAGTGEPASFRSPTRTTCTRTATWRWAEWTPCCSTRCSPSAASAATPGSSIRPANVGVGHYVGILAPGNSELRDRIERDPPSGDARRAARGDLPPMGHVERRPAAPVRAAS